MKTVIVTELQQLGALLSNTRWCSLEMLHLNGRFLIHFGDGFPVVVALVTSLAVVALVGVPVGIVSFEGLAVNVEHFMFGTVGIGPFPSETLKGVSHFLTLKSPFKSVDIHFYTRAQGGSLFV